MLIQIRLKGDENLFYDFFTQLDWWETITIRYFGSFFIPMNSYCEMFFLLSLQCEICNPKNINYGILKQRDDCSSQVIGEVGSYVERQQVGGKR